MVDHTPLVAPYLGSDARLGTNPICLAVPGGTRSAPLLLDMATSLIAGCLLELLAGQVAATPADSGSRIVCAGLPGERHENPGLFWALKQTWAGHRVVWLGIDLPLDELDRACELLLPAEVHLSVTLPRTLQACRSELRDFERRWSGRAVVRVGGAGVEQAAASPA